MSVAYPSSPSFRLIRLLDVALALWTAAWIAMGVLVGLAVNDLKQLSRTVVIAGQAVEQAGEDLQRLESLPLVGERLGDVGSRVQETARDAITSGRGTQDTIEFLAVLLGVSIALIPTVPLIALYGPLRWSRVQEVRAVRRVMGDAGDDPLFLQFLAHRAVERLPYHLLREVSENPWLDLESGRHERLAAAELARLGVTDAAPAARESRGSREGREA